jgi:hypothetical protein
MAVALRECDVYLVTPLFLQISPIKVVNVVCFTGVAVYHILRVSSSAYNEVIEI